MHKINKEETTMIEYKVITTSVRDAEKDINALAGEGWQVIATDVISGAAFSVNSTPMIVTLGRKI